MEGAGRFLRRLWNMIGEDIERLSGAPSFAGDPGTLSGDDKALCGAVHRTIQAATDDYEVTRHFNTAIARVFELVNAVRAAKGADPAVLRLAYETVIQLLAPITPHICAELWNVLGHDGAVVGTHDERAAGEHDEGHRRRTAEERGHWNSIPARGVLPASLAPSRSFATFPRALVQ